MMMMTSTRFWQLLIFIQFHRQLFVIAEQSWSSQNFPNPRTAGFSACRMRSISNICDPDQVVSESDRYRLNYELLQIEIRTAHTQGEFCDKKGQTVVLAIVRQSTDGQQLADDLRSRWSLDVQCHKDMVIVLVAGQNQLFISSDTNAPSSAQLSSAISNQQSQLQNGQYTAALIQLFKEVISVAGAGSVPASPTNSGGNTNYGNKYNNNNKSNGQSGSILCSSSSLAKVLVVFSIVYYVTSAAVVAS